MAKHQLMSRTKTEELSPSEIFTPEFLAALNGVDVEVKYVDSRGKKTERTLMNCTFQLSLEGNLLCVGFDPEEKQVRSLRVDRMLSLQALGTGEKNDESQGRAA